MHPVLPPASSSLLEAYKKHTGELSGIEDRQNKTIALLLGIFSAAGTLLLKDGSHVGYFGATYLSLMAIIITCIGHHAINELHDLRIAVRDLLVRCEIGLGFYRDDAFLAGRPLYTPYEGKYPTRGGWMKQNYWIVWVVAAGFIGLLFLKAYPTGARSLQIFWSR